jgi:hypothetical protein
MSVLPRPAQPVDATLYPRWKDGVYSVISEESRLSVSSQAHLDKWCVSSTNGHVKLWELKSQQKDLMQVLRRPVETTPRKQKLIGASRMSAPGPITDIGPASSTTKRAAAASLPLSYADVLYAFLKRHKWIRCAPRLLHLLGSSACRFITTRLRCGPVEVHRDRRRCSRPRSRKP